MRCNLISHGAFPSFGNDSDDNLSMLLAELFGGIAELRAELRSLLGADWEDLERFQRELNRIESGARLLRLSVLMVKSSGH
jgi:hypothetical protein